ncbi:phosphoadenylyl-sulfate reductase [Erythrobacter sp. SD-21]|uniref:phosphoadenylyl-sulfate reductase n=1 Tax=Erythrobacter sp. SD-21 TaxID=161528 RepID=UPI000153F5AA|nr:phosphoadenylyl-sulfate reductase [Erythrobacter sp. SD-21]EDL49355.1 phosphoadenosine phosphosulfate reductase [Erythrobacter sp. SD-21]
MLLEGDLYGDARLTPEREGKTLAFLAESILRDYPGCVAMVSSFGAESIVLLDMVARINPNTPILLNETGMLFAETLEYQREVSALLGLTNVQLVRPTRQRLAEEDPNGLLHRNDSDACCSLRKSEPLRRALAPFDAWITGRKKFQNDKRAEMQPVEQDGAGRVKLNPLADWTPSDIRDYFDRYNLPRHPLVSQGYPSIGCAPCTSRVLAGEDARAGRWRGTEKTECGIHYVEGQFIAGAGI